MRTILTVAFCVALAVGYVVHVEGRLGAVELMGLKEGEMRTEWTSGGVRKFVVTQREPGESDAAWLDRHVVAVKAAQAEFPPD